MTHASLDELEVQLPHLLASPRDGGTLMMIVRRPDVDLREVLDAGELDPVEGLVGDDWIMRGSGQTTDGSAHPDTQLTLMNARIIDAIAGSRDRWRLAGDQLYVDLDLSPENLSPGTRLQMGEAVIEVTAEPHLGCGKFSDRFGQDALRFVNDERGREGNFRGVYARVVDGGAIHIGDSIIRL